MIQTVTQSCTAMLNGYWSYEMSLYHVQKLFYQLNRDEVIST